MKFGLAAIVMGAAFLLFLPFAGGGENSTPLLAIVGIFFVFTVAELLLSPVGLSVTTKLAPEAFQTQMVALFFLSVSLGTAISGQLATLYNPVARAHRHRGRRRAAAVREARAELMRGVR